MDNIIAIRIERVDNEYSQIEEEVQPAVVVKVKCYK